MTLRPSYCRGLMQFYTIYIQGTNTGAAEAEAVEHPGVPGKLNPPLQHTSCWLTDFLILMVCSPLSSLRQVLSPQYLHVQAFSLKVSIYYQNCRDSYCRRTSPLQPSVSSCPRSGQPIRLSGLHGSKASSAPEASLPRKMNSTT